MNYLKTANEYVQMYDLFQSKLYIIANTKYVFFYLV